MCTNSQKESTSHSFLIHDIYCTGRRSCATRTRRRRSCRPRPPRPTLPRRPRTAPPLSLAGRPAVVGGDRARRGRSSEAEHMASAAIAAAASSSSPASASPSLPRASPRAAALSGARDRLGDESLEYGRARRSSRRSPSAPGRGRVSTSHQHGAPSRTPRFSFPLLRYPLPAVVLPQGRTSRRPSARRACRSTDDHLLADAALSR